MTVQSDASETGSVIQCDTILVSDTVGWKVAFSYNIFKWGHQSHIISFSMWHILLMENCVVPKWQLNICVCYYQGAVNMTTTVDSMSSSKGSPGSYQCNLFPYKRITAPSTVRHSSLMAQSGLEALVHHFTLNFFRRLKSCIVQDKTTTECSVTSTISMYYHWAQMYYACMCHFQLRIGETLLY